MTAPPSVPVRAAAEDHVFVPAGAGLHIIRLLTLHKAMTTLILQPAPPPEEERQAVNTIRQGPNRVTEVMHRGPTNTLSVAYSIK